MFTAEGRAAEIRVGHRLALTLGRWRVSRGGTVLGDLSATGTADILSRDAFWATQAPLELFLHMGTVWWHWPLASFEDHGRSCSFRVTGDPEIEDV